ALAAPAWSTTASSAELLDNMWLLTLVAVLFATLAPRLLSAFDVDVGAIGWGLLGLGAVHVALAAAADAERVRPAWLPPLLGAIHTAGVLLIGAIWQHAGGLQNPSFLLAFVFPVIGATFVARRLPYLTAALGILVAGTVALRQTPELRWYLESLNPGGAWLTALVGRAASVTSPLPGFYAPAGYFIVTLAAFAILLSACAVSAEFLASLFAKLHRHTQSAHQELARAQDLWTALVRELPLPVALVDPDTLQVVHASKLWAKTFGDHEAARAAGLFDIVQFSYPEVVEELLVGDGGTTHPCMLRVAGQLRATEIRVQHLWHAKRRLALVIMQDVTESLCLSAALDAAGYAALVVDARERVMAFNKPARGFLAELDLGIDASELLSQLGDRGGWRPGLSGRRKSHAKIRGRAYEVRTCSIALPGEEECIYLIAMAPLPRAAADTLTADTQAMPRI
ncbi:MAG TPA: hypothetical protein VF931_02815, partial [Steroidobacteraceae bacterium]